VLERRDLALDGPGRDRQAHRKTEHDRGVAEREEEPGPQVPLALLEEFPGDVVDGRDVVGVERVAKAEPVRERPQTGHGRVPRGVRREQAPSHDVEEGDGCAEPSEAPPFRVRERPA
jgi:hypothetical protein